MGTTVSVEGTHQIQEGWVLAHERVPSALQAVAAQVAASGLRHHPRE